MQFRRSFGPELARLITKNCIAVAVPGGNTISVQTATGKTLKSEIAELPTKGMREWSRLPEVDRKPTSLKPSSDDRGRGPPPPGMLVSRVYIRALERDKAGSLIPRKKDSLTYSGPQRNFLWLTEKEWKALVPAQPVVGRLVAVPAPIQDRIFRYYLYDGSYGAMLAWWRPKDHKTGTLRLIITESSAMRIQFRLEGDACLRDHPDAERATRQADFRLLGRLSYDVRKKVFDQFDVVAVGDYRDDRAAPPRLRRTTVGVAFELATPGSLGYGTPPVGIRDAASERDQVVQYFGSDKDEGILRYFGLAK